MAAKTRVALFLEDSAQEAFIPALFERLILEEGFQNNLFDIQILSARGGGSISAATQFLKDARRSRSLQADLLIVGSDANCTGFLKRRGLIEKAAAKSPYQEIITAIPDPHIERWYLLDANAFSPALKDRLTVASPTYKCEKNRYKTLLKQAFSNVGIIPPLGGIEYGHLVVKHMELYAAAKQDRGLADFIDASRAWLKRLKTY